MKKIIKVKLGEPVEDSAKLIKIEKEREQKVNVDPGLSYAVNYFEEVEYCYFEVIEETKTN